MKTMMLQQNKCGGLEWQHRDMFPSIESFRSWRRPTTGNHFNFGRSISLCCPRVRAKYAQCTETHRSSVHPNCLHSCRSHYSATLYRDKRHCNIWTAPYCNLHARSHKETQLGPTTQPLSTTHHFHFQLWAYLVQFPR